MPKRRRSCPLRSDFDIPFVGKMVPSLPTNVIPSMKDVLKVVFHLQLETRLPRMKCISKVTKSLMNMTLPGYKFKAKSHIAREIKKTLNEWQSNVKY